MACNENKCIRCAVTSCTHHCDGSDFCSLGSIQVGTHESEPEFCQCTDCQSFQAK